MTSALMNVYRRADVAFVKGEGMWVYDERGERHLDFAAGIAVNALGHAHPRLVEALCAQARRIWHTSNLYRIPDQDRLAERLCAASFADRVFFTNSGVEAVECAIKTARRHFSARGERRYRIVTLEGSFHGRSMAAISAAGQEKLTAGFEPLLPGFAQVPPEDVDALAAAIDDETAAIMLEPVQGEGGVRPLSAEYLRAVRELADAHGLLLILDEIQCGMGRTGRLFAYEWAGIRPDILVSAKGIGGGFPLGACLATEAAASGMGPGTHGTTYGGNHLAMAVGNAVLDEILAPGFLERVREIGDVLGAALEDFARARPDRVVEARGTGLMRGLKLTDGHDPRAVMRRALENRLLIVPAGDNVIRLLPPLICEREHVAEAMRRLDATLAG